MGASRLCVFVSAVPPYGTRAQRWTPSPLILDLPLGEDTGRNALVGVLCEGLEGAAVSLRPIPGEIDSATD